MKEQAAWIDDPLPEEVASWLSGRDWRRVTESAGHAALWCSGPNEVLQPRIIEASDYALRMSDLLTSLAVWSGSTPDAVAQEMVTQGSDVAEWRAVGLHERAISLPLEDGLTLIQSVRNALVAAANSTMQRRAYFGHSTLKIARLHARSVHMGQTRRGSYIVPIISRIPGALEPVSDVDRLSLEVRAQPFERRVMAQLAESLAAIREMAVDSSQEPTQRQLNDSVAQGVSHELCAAVAGALEAEAVSELDVSFSWAERIGGHPGVRSLTLPKQAGPVIGRMAEKLRGSDVVGEQALVGLVRSHRREPDEDDGWVYLRATIGDKLKTVGLPVTSEQLHEALMAADEKRPVHVRGRLSRAVGGAWRFDSVSDFGLAGDRLFT